MSYFTKLPIEISAVRLIEQIVIKTREGEMVGNPGDWLITGVEGEIYPCNHEIFKKTYTPSGVDKCDYCKHRTRCLDLCDCVCDYFEWG